MVDSKTAKTSRARRFLRNREAKLNENPKTALLVRGQKTSGLINSILIDLFMLKKPYGFFSMNRSMRMLLISPEVFWPRTSRAVFGFSLSFASRFLRKRRARDVFAVFESTMWTRRARL